jgi:hypothetical protein
LPGTERPVSSAAQLKIGHVPATATAAPDTVRRKSLLEVIQRFPGKGFPDKCCSCEAIRANFVASLCAE